MLKLFNFYSESVNVERYKSTYLGNKLITLSPVFEIKQKIT